MYTLNSTDLYTGTGFYCVITSNEIPCVDNMKNIHVFVLDLCDTFHIHNGRNWNTAKDEDVNSESDTGERTQSLKGK